jgi:3'-phosphoadenosine 5'-phosphosulfate sulfotransferase (PAPS reductase)/FAD synthetase
MKKRPMKKYAKETGRVPIIATMANESRSRRATWLRMGCNAFSGKKPSSQPMSFWTEEDVLEYLYTYQIPYAPVYGEIIKTDGGGGQQQEKSVLAVSFVPLALIWKRHRTVSNV